MNSHDLGPAMAAAAVGEKTKANADRVSDLERRVEFLEMTLLQVSAILARNAADGLDQVLKGIKQ